MNAAGGRAGSERARRGDLLSRTKAFALRIIRMYMALPKTDIARVLGKQVLRSGTSVGANYCEAHHARSTAEFVSKIELAVQELVETRYWLDLLVEGGAVPERRLQNLRKESSELIAILIASAKTAKQRK
jgi:four helix bundle protein